MEGRMETEQFHKEFEDPKSQSLSPIIIPHILNLYASRATAEDFETYDPNATFEGPLTSAHGVKQIKSSFYAVPKNQTISYVYKVFSETRIVEYSIQENAVAPGKLEILIDGKQYYKIFGKEIDLISLIKLDIHDGKIIRHEDWSMACLECRLEEIRLESVQDMMWLCYFRLSQPS